MSERKKDMVLELEKKAKRIKKIQFTINTILANGCYSDKEMENQIKTGRNIGNLDDHEEKILRKAWEFRNKLARELLTDMEGFLNDNV